MRMSYYVPAVGKVNAALYTQILIDHFGVDAIVHTGIAGSMDETVRHLDVVVADGLTYYDVRRTAEILFPESDRFCR